jgi:uncharacterized membrane protein YdjX (TVP38/TMEM64 family)
MVERIKKIKPSTWIKLIIGGLIFAVMVIAFPFAHFSQLLTVNRVIEAVKSMQMNWWTVFSFYVLFVFGVMALPITFFPIVGGVLLNFWIALPLNILAATIGAANAFFLTRYFGREGVRYFMRGKVKLVDRMARQEGLKAVFFIRWIGIPPFLVANYLLGLSGVKLKDYLLGTALGIFPWMAIVTYSARILWQALLVGGEKGFKNALWATMGPLTILSGLILVVVGVSCYFKKRSRLRLPTVQHTMV